MQSVYLNSQNKLKYLQSFMIAFYLKLIRNTQKNNKKDYNYINYVIATEEKYIFFSIF